MGIDPNFKNSMNKLIPNAESKIKMNNIIDLYEEYFDGERVDYNYEVVNTKTTALLKDPKNCHRTVSCIDWQTDELRLAAA